MQVLILFTGVVDLFGLAAFVPVLSAVANPQIISSNRFFSSLKQFLNVESNNHFLLILFVSAFFFFFLRSVFILYSQWLQSKFVFVLSEYIGEKAYRYYMDLDYQTFQKKQSAEIIRELTLSPQHFSKFLVMPLLLLSAEMLIVVLIITGIAIFDIKVFLLLIVTIFPAAFIFHRLVKKRLKHYGEEQNRETPKLYSNSNRGINGFIDVKLRNKESVLIDDYIGVFKKLNRINVVTTTLNIFPAKLFELVTVGGLMVIFIYGAFMANNPAVVIPLIAVYAAAGYRIIPSLSKVIPALMQLEQFSYLFGIYNAPLKSNVEANYKKQEEISFEKAIELNGISFRFKDEAECFISNMNLTIKKGEVVGVIGKSGSGKSTLVKIITGFLRSEKGSLTVDGVSIDDRNMRSWMNHISYVQQSPYLEKGSLASNIAFLETNIDMARLNKVIGMASLTSLVNGRNPLDILIDEEGKNLSGGQKQRILIARALYHNSQLIIFDEATSALDNQTEEEVNETLKQIKGTGVTIIIIAHRYSTLIHTDRILQFNDNNELVETSYLKLQSM
ncbi:MAG: ABC transporter ATP-binding protein [Bacteroidetes bacterium]|nr:ABC transporter ATP-binding protein [Bacteroidota bacterium]